MYSMEALRVSILTSRDSFCIADALSSKVHGVHKANLTQWNWTFQPASRWISITGLSNRTYIEANSWVWNTPNNTYENIFKEQDDEAALGYNYTVRIPETYNASTVYPLVVFLHGGIEFDYSNDNAESAYRNGNYIAYNAGEHVVVVEPDKNDVDWNPEKIRDVIADVSKNININAQRVYLTGVSMGGRGTFIVCAGLPDTFAAIAPLSPHHQPTLIDPITGAEGNYTSLHIPDTIPVFFHHSYNDTVSSYTMAFDTMRIILSDARSDSTFRYVDGDYGHGGWVTVLYGNPDNLQWLLSHTKS